MLTSYDPCPREFFNAYLTTALWSSTDDNDYPLDSVYSTDDLAPETLAAMRKDCDRFYAENYDDLNCDGVKFGPDFGQDGRGGHDFWLTRNRHGAGFWDGDWPEPQASKLTDAAHGFSECYLYVGDDGLLYLE